VLRELFLFFHFIGFGLIVTLNVAGIILNRHYKKAPDLQQKGVILRAARTLGLLSPVAILIMLVTGIGNMHSLAFGILTVGWLTAKIILFAILATSGVLFGIKARKRGALVKSMVSGNAPSNADELLAEYDKQISLSYIVMPLLTIMILCLSIYGRLGGQ